MVRIMNKKNTFDKARMPNWSNEEYKIIGTDNNNFMLNHPTKRKLFLRHENQKMIFRLKKWMYKYIKSEVKIDKGEH